MEIREQTGRGKKTLRLGSSNQGLPQQQYGMQATTLLDGIVVVAVEFLKRSLDLVMAGMEKEK